MKKVFLASISLLASFIINAQTPSGINYQAAARDNAGNVLASQSVSFRLSILQGSTSGTDVYQEVHTTTTNALGLVNLVIGTGTVNVGTFQSINWANGPYFLSVEMSVGTGAFQQMGTSQFVSVPYALYAEKSGNKTYAGNGITISNDTIKSTWTQTGADVTSNNTGNVGIGTNPADQKLEVNGGVKIGNTYNSAEGSIRYSGTDFEGATASGWKSLTKSNNSYYALNSFNYVSSTIRNAVVFSTDSLIVPETGNYLIIYNGRGNNQNSYDIANNSYDLEGRTGVINVTQNAGSFIGQVYDMMYGSYDINTPSSTYHQYISSTYNVSTYSSLNAGDVLKAASLIFSYGTAPTTTWGFTPFKIQLIKLN